MENENTEALHLEPCWPFWGLLKVAEKPSYLKGGFVEISHTLEYPRNDFFNKFRWVGMQALALLKRRNIEEIGSAAEEIHSAIFDYIDQYIEQETESYVQRIASSGGWELGYLPEGSRGTEDEIRYLLNNWSGEWDDRPDLPSRDEINDLDALADCLQFDNFNETDLIHFGLVEPEEHEFYAVLALMITCNAIHSNPPPVHPNSESLSRVMAIGHGTINAIGAITHADRIQFEGKIRKAIAAEQPAILAAELNKRINDREIESKKKLSDAGVKGSEIRHAVSKELKDWALMEGKKLKGLPADKARELMKRLPLHIAKKLREAGDKLKDPERVVRDALAAQRNK